MSKLTDEQRQKRDMIKLETEIMMAERMSEHYALEAKALRNKMNRLERGK